MFTLLSHAMSEDTGVNADSSQQKSATTRRSSNHKLTACQTKGNQLGCGFVRKGMQEQMEFTKEERPCQEVHKGQTRIEAAVCREG